MMRLVAAGASSTAPGSYKPAPGCDCLLQEVQDAFEVRQGCCWWLRPRRGAAALSVDGPVSADAAYRTPHGGLAGIKWSRYKALCGCFTCAALLPDGCSAAASLAPLHLTAAATLQLHAHTAVVPL